VAGPQASLLALVRMTGSMRTQTNVHTPDGLDRILAVVGLVGVFTLVGSLVSLLLF